jgi:hypothetical protein
VIVHWKFEQLEKSGSVADPVFFDEAVDVPCTTQVPSIDGVVAVPATAPVAAVVGPSTVEVRSTPHAAIATSAVSAELNRRKDLFMGIVSCIGRDTFGRHISITESSSDLQFWPEPDCTTRYF